MWIWNYICYELNLREVKIEILGRQRWCLCRGRRFGLDFHTSLEPGNAWYQYYFGHYSQRYYYIDININWLLYNILMNFISIISFNPPNNTWGNFKYTLPFYLWENRRNIKLKSLIIKSVNGRVRIQNLVLWLQSSSCIFSLSCSAYTIWLQKCTLFGDPVQAEIANDKNHLM